MCWELFFNIIIVGNLQKANRQAEHKIAKLESEKKQKKKELEQQDELRKALIAADAANRAKSTFLLNMIMTFAHHSMESWVC